MTPASIISNRVEIIHHFVPFRTRNQIPPLSKLYRAQAALHFMILCLMQAQVEGPYFNLRARDMRRDTAVNEL